MEKAALSPSVGRVGVRKSQGSKLVHKIDSLQVVIGSGERQRLHHKAVASDKFLILTDAWGCARRREKHPMFRPSFLACRSLLSLPLIRQVAIEFEFRFRKSRLQGAFQVCIKE